MTPKFKGLGHPRFAVRPYPSEWRRRLVLGEDWSILVRPVRPEDELLVQKFFQKVTRGSPASLFRGREGVHHTFIARLTQLDYARAIAFVTIDEAPVK
jgi:acetyltransferase